MTFEMCDDGHAVENPGRRKVLPRILIDLFFNGNESGADPWARCSFRNVFSVYVELIGRGEVIPGWIPFGPRIRFVSENEITVRRGNGHRLGPRVEAGLSHELNH